MRNIFIFWGALLLVDGVFGVDVSVMKGDSVTLNPHTEIPENDTAEWFFGKERIARMNKADELFSTYEDVVVRFKGKLELNNQTGSLTITNLTTNHAGLYKLKILSRDVTPDQTFSVTVSSDNVKSVMEGDTVTLYTDVAGIQRDEIQWKFGDPGIFIAGLNGAADASWNNIDLNDETGDLTIRNIRRNQFGDYEVKMKNKHSLMFQGKFRISTLEIKIMPVKEGDSVTLQTDTKTQRDDQIRWMFGPESTHIAKINRTASEFSLYEDVLDGRFRGRLKLDRQTGSLTIMNTRTTDTGLYKLQIISNSEATKCTTFAVAVTEIRYSSLETLLMGILFVIGIVIVIVIGIIVFVIKKKK